MGVKCDWIPLSEGKKFWERADADDNRGFLSFPFVHFEPHVCCLFSSCFFLICGVVVPQQRNQVVHIQSQLHVPSTDALKVSKITQRTATYSNVH